MKTLAKYSFDASCENPERAHSFFEEATSVIEDWLKEKGQSNERVGGVYDVELNDGRNAELRLNGFDLEENRGSLNSWELSEPNDLGQFRTLVSVAVKESQLALHVELSAIAKQNRIAPYKPTVRCPRLIRRLLEREIPWSFASHRPPLESVKYHGQGATARFVEELHNTERNLPLVAVSQIYGNYLEPELPEKLAADLAGVATVADLDNQCAWGITEQLGKEWSCYLGAIRIYWPMSTNADWRDHPVFFDRYQRGETSHQFVQKMKQEVRNRIFDVSVFSLDRPVIFAELERLQRREKSNAKIMAARKRHAEAQQQKGELEEKTGIFDMAMEENTTLLKRIQDLESETEFCYGEIDRLESINSRLNDENRSLKYQVQSWPRSTASEGAASETEQPEVPVETLAEAYHKARERFANVLQFGGHVEGGVADMHPDTGPPQKVYYYLEKLAELAAIKAAGESLGKTMAGWFAEQNIEYGGESGTKSGNRDFQNKRTWHDGENNIYFEDHLKPNQATHPDKCVRIYFKWLEDRKKIVVGWLGKHP